MRYDRLGNIVAGVGNGIVSVNGLRITSKVGGGAFWKRDNNPGAQVLNDDGSYQCSEFTAPNWDEISLRFSGASLLVGGNGNWAGTLRSNPVLTFGVWQGSPLDAEIRQTCSVVDGSRDGSLCFIRRSDGVIVTLWGDGIQTDEAAIPNLNVGSLRVTEDQSIVYFVNGAMWMRLRNGAAVQIPTVIAPYNPYVFRALDSRLWALYQNKEIYLHPIDEQKGHVWRNPYSGSPDVVTVNGRTQVCWSAGPAEAPSDLQHSEWFTLGENTVPLDVPSVVHPMDAFNHPVTVAVFKDPEGASDAPVEIIVNQTGQSTRRPCFAAEDSVMYQGELLGIYTEDKNPIAALDKAKHLNTRLLWGWDAPTRPIMPSILRPWDIVAIELYLQQGETLSQSVTRWTQNLLYVYDVWHGDIAVIPQFYCAGGAPPDELWTVQEVLDGLAYLASLVNLVPRVKIVAAFEWLRANGITAHEELREAFNLLLKATAGVATLTPVGTAPHPQPTPVPTPTPAPILPEPIHHDSYLQGAFMPDVSKRGYILDQLTGEVAYVDPNHPDVVVWHQHPLDLVNGGGYEEVETSDQQADGTRSLQWYSAGVYVSIGGDGTVRSRTAVGGDESFYIVKMPNGSSFDITLAYPRHTDVNGRNSVPRVLVFLEIQNPR